MIRQTCSIWLILSLVLVASLAVAGERDCQQRLVIVGDDGNEATVTFNGNRLRVVATEDGNSSVHEFDFSCLEGLIDEAVTSAMAGLEAAFEDLERQEISIGMDGPDQIVISHGDQTAAFNLEVLAAELERTLADIHLDFGRELEPDEFVQITSEQDEAEQLREELDNLKAELARLRSDLQRVR